MEQQEKLARAREKVRAMTGFYLHLAIFVVVIGILAVINVLTGKWWVIWPLLGWGAFVVAHGVAVFSDMPGSFKRWQDRKAQEIADKM